MSIYRLYRLAEIMDGNNIVAIVIDAIIKILGGAKFVIDLTLVISLLYDISKFNASVEVL